MNDEIKEALFTTNAVRVCEADCPFWYTSGKLGPFYINTHFLYGSEEEADALLTEIENAAAQDRQLFPTRILSILLKQYESNSLYKMVTNTLIKNAKKESVDFYAGGERRDFFFSILPAYFLKKPHLSIFKDGEAVYSDVGFQKTINAGDADLKGKTALHIVDLITEASSFTRSWLSVIRGFGAEMLAALTVVDRLQGGMEILKNEKVSGKSLVEIDRSLFQNAKERGNIDEKQMELVVDFIENPDLFMPEFLAKNPDFIATQLLLGRKNEQRARLAIEKGYAKP